MEEAGWLPAAKSRGAPGHLAPALGPGPRPLWAWLLLHVANGCGTDCAQESAAFLASVRNLGEDGKLLNPLLVQVPTIASSWRLDGHPPTHISDSPSAACSPRRPCARHCEEEERERRRGNPTRSYCLALHFAQ